MAEPEQPAFDAAAELPPDLSEYARDLITLWQSELSALAVDREIQEGFQRGLSLWGVMAQNFAQLLPGAAHAPKSGSAGSPFDEAHRRPGPAAPPRTAPAAAPSDPRDQELARLAERIAELERRLDQSGG